MSQANLVSEAQWECEVLQESLDHKVQREQWDLQVKMVNLDCQEARERPDQLDPLVSRVSKVSEETLDVKVIKVPLV